MLVKGWTTDETGLECYLGFDEKTGGSTVSVKDGRACISRC